MSDKMQTVSPSDPLEAAILTKLAAGFTYDQIAVEHKISRGKVWSVAVRYGARKREALIQERARDRKLRQTEFLREVINATEKADVLDFLAGIPDESTQLFLTSIPYNIGKSYGGSHGSDRQRFHYSLGWMLQVLSEMDRSLKPGGVIFLQAGSTKDDSGNLYPLDCLFFEHLRGMGLMFQSRVIWHIKHGLTPKRRLSERHESALVFSKGLPAHFNPTPARAPQKQPGKRAFKGKHIGKLSGSPLGAWPSNVWEISNIGNNHPERTGHPAQMPEKLAKRAVLLYTLPEDLVIDPFMGSGTVASVCKQTGRAFSGADLSYEDLRAKRLAKVVPDLACELPGVTDDSIAIWQAEAKAVHVPLAIGN